MKEITIIAGLDDRQMKYPWYSTGITGEEIAVDHVGGGLLVKIRHGDGYICSGSSNMPIGSPIVGSSGWSELWFGDIKHYSLRDIDEDKYN